MRGLTGQQRYRIEQVISAVFGGLHNAPRIHWHDEHEHFGWAEINPHACQMSTFDGNRLTALVFACHDWCVRAELANGGPHRVKIRLHPRSARSTPHSFYERHPTLANAVTSWRRDNHIEDGL